MKRSPVLLYGRDLSQLSWALNSNQLYLGWRFMKQQEVVFSVRRTGFNRAAVLASLAVAAMTVGSSQASAAIICSTTPVSIPADLNGVYVNFVTGATGTSGTAIAGWDFSAYASGPTLR